MNIFRRIRFGEWWEYKMPVLLALGYATVVRENKNLLEFVYWFAFLLLSITGGAIYVSLINDITDLEEDKASGKSNRLQKLSSVRRGLLLSASLFAGAICGYFLSDDGLSLVLYAMAYVSFTLYSVPPLRLKKKGIWGVMADACGAHVFPSLLMVAGTAHYFHLHFNPAWFFATAAWALMYGLRGILWHQFFDRENDIRIGSGTFAATRNPASFKSVASIIFILELVALTLMLISIGKILPLIALAVYALLATAYRRRLGFRLIAIVPPPGQPVHILMSSYYQVFLPLSLLVQAVMIFPSAWILLLVHLALFPRGLWNVLLSIRAMTTVRAVN